MISPTSGANFDVSASGTVKVSFRSIRAPMSAETLTI